MVGPVQDGAYLPVQPFALVFQNEQFAWPVQRSEVNSPFFGHYSKVDLRFRQAEGLLVRA